MSCLSLPSPKGPDSYFPKHPIAGAENCLGTLAFSSILNMLLSYDVYFTDDHAKEADRPVYVCAATCRGLYYDHLCILPPMGLY